MGPRPNGRGKSRRRRRRCLAGRVNGAAAKRPRKAPGGRHAVRPAAARQWGRGQTAAERRVPLPGPRLAPMSRQWGRGQTAAERASSVARHDRPVRASMGPRPNGRGKLVRAIYELEIHERQWGRGQTAAESRFPLGPHNEPRASMGPRPNGRGKNAAPARQCVPCRGVNGAAAKRPRKGWRCMRTTALSWSVNGAAAKRPRKACGPRRPPADVRASMGPRPNGRGKPRGRGPIIKR